MAKSKADEWLEKDKLTLLEGWARNGLTDEQIANNIGISRSTLFEWRKNNQDISNALKKGKEVVDIEVENALLKRALGYTYKEVTKEQVKNPTTGQYEMMITKEVTKEIQPDTTAQIFWLKNRRKQQWRDKVEVETNGEELNKVRELLTKISDGANNG
mgnify:CR=1 FL=1